MTKRALGIAVALLLLITAFLIGAQLAPETTGEPTRRLPTAPQDFALESMNNRIRLSWSDPTDLGDTSKIGFTLWRGTSADNLNILANKGPFTYEHLDQGLTNGNYFYYGVVCVNEEGVGEMTSVLSAKPVGPPGVPMNISITYDSNLVKFSWEPPEDNGGDDIIGYRILKGPNEAQLNTIIDLPVTTSYEDTDVVNGRSYSYKLRASNGFEVNGTVTKTYSITPRGTPAAPTNFNVTGLDRKVQLNWTYPIDDGGAGIMGYKIYRGLTEEEMVDYAYVSSLTGYLDTNISNGRSYFYAVSGVNSEGEGEKTSIKNVIPIGVPDSPLNLTVRPGDAEAYLEWKPPVDDGGSDILGYNVFRTIQGAQMELVGDAELNLEFTDTNLTNGKTYYYQVKAYNDQGDGYPSENVDVQPDFAPAAPLNFRVKEDLGYNKLIWSHASVSLDYPVIEYRLFRGETESGLALLTTLNASFAIYEDYDVEVGVEYYYSIRSFSEIGVGPSSPIIIGIPYSAPTLVMNLAVSPEDKIVRLTWTEPDFNGGREIINYKIFRGEKSDKLAVIETISGSMAMYNDTNVANGVTYYYAIMPVNVEMDGNLTSTVEGTPLGPPQSPRKLVTSVIDDAIILEWDPPLSDGGMAITGYIILRGTSQLNLSVYETIGIVLNYTDSNVEKGINYYYAIVAKNDIGEGKQSSPESGIVYAESGDEKEKTNILPLAIAGIIAFLIVIALVIFVVVMSKKKKKEEEDGKQEFEESDREKEHRLVLERREQMKEFTDVALNTEEAHAHDHDEHNLSYDDLYGNMDDAEVEEGSVEEQPTNEGEETQEAEPAPPDYKPPDEGAPPEPQAAPMEQAIPPEKPQGEQTGEYIPPQQE